jgi:serine/threonine-protein kinase SRPK3
VGSFTLVRRATIRPDPASHSDSIDLKPENVLICIDDVESIIQAELATASANPSSPPTKLVGVPPSKGRGGNQTPRTESIFITGSQPLPSPSSSFGSSPALDKWAFGMSKIDGEGSVGSEKRADSTEAAVEGISNVTLESNGIGGKNESLHSAIPPGPSLLTQQAPQELTEPHPPTRHAPIFHLADDTMSSDVPPSSSLMSVDSEMSRNTETSSSSVMDGLEKITVKIADLGNGEC